MVARHETGEKIFSCPQCTKSFALEANFTRHVTLYKVEADKPIVCDVCDRRFSDDEELKQHYVIHNKKRSICPQCGDACFDKVDLERYVCLYKKIISLY